MSPAWHRSSAEAQAVPQCRSDRCAQRNIGSEFSACGLRSTWKTKAPRPALRALACAPSGAARMDRSTTGRMSGVSLRLDLFTSPVSPCGGAGDAAFGNDAGLPASNPWHRFTLTRLPEPSVLAPVGTDLAGSSWGGPRSFGSSPRPRCPHPASTHTEVRSEVTCHPPPEGDRSPGARRRRVCPVVSPHRPSTTSCPVPSGRSSRSPSPAPPEGDHRPGLTRRPPRSPGTVADSSLPPYPRRSPAARCEVAVNTVRAPIPLCLLHGAGWAEAPSSPPVACALRNEDQ